LIAVVPDFTTGRRKLGLIGGPSISGREGGSGELRGAFHRPSVTVAGRSGGGEGDRRGEGGSSVAGGVSARGQISVQGTAIKPGANLF